MEEIVSETSYPLYTEVVKRVETTEREYNLEAIWDVIHQYLRYNSISTEDE